MLCLGHRYYLMYNDEIPFKLYLNNNFTIEYIDKVVTSLQVYFYDYEVSEKEQKMKDEIEENKQLRTCLCKTHN